LHLHRDSAESLGNPPNVSLSLNFGFICSSNAIHGSVYQQPEEQASIVCSFGVDVATCSNKLKFKVWRSRFFDDFTCTALPMFFNGPTGKLALNGRGSSHRFAESSMLEPVAVCSSGCALRWKNSLLLSSKFDQDDRVVPTDDDDRNNDWAQCAVTSTGGAENLSFWPEVVLAGHALTAVGCDRTTHAAATPETSFHSVTNTNQ
jgi:hypothetical protein